VSDIIWLECLRTCKNHTTHTTLAADRNQENLRISQTKSQTISDSYGRLTKARYEYSQELGCRPSRRSDASRSSQSQRNFLQRHHHGDGAFWYHSQKRKFSAVGTRASRVVRGSPQVHCRPIVHVTPCPLAPILPDLRLQISSITISNY